VRRARRLAALLLGLAACAPAPDERPDLLLVVVDTLRADHLSVYGYERPTSPHLQALAAGGVVFEDVTAQSSWTRPSMVSMLTGRRVFVNAQRMPDAIPALAERLRDAGYQTAAFVANPAISEREDFDRGFETFVTRDDTGGTTWDAPDLEAAFADWSAATPRDGRPRFVWLHYMDPHDPYEPKGRPTLGGQVRLRDDVIEAWTRVVLEAGEGTPLYEYFDRDRRYILDRIDAYDREVANVDASLARVLEALAAERGPDREQLVVVSADHGEGLWDHEHHPELVARLPEQDRTLRHVFWRDHSYHLYRELLFTPLVAWGPGLPAGVRVAEPVENVDVAPTLLRAAGLRAGGLDGRALQDVAAGRAAPRPYVLAHCNEGTSVRRTDTGLKLVFPTDTGYSFGMRESLYDVERDPHERNDLYPRAEAASPWLEATRELLEVREERIAAFDLYEGDSHEASSPESRRVLEELGYLGGR